MERSPLPLGRPRTERADAARNREQLLAAAREMVAELGADKVTMDGLAERAGLGKGTVYRRFGTRAGIFHALLDDDEHAFQRQVLAGPPPLGPGAAPLERLVAYGRARIAYLLDHVTIVRAALDRHRPVPAEGGSMFTQAHIRMLLGGADTGVADLDSLTVQLTSALEGPFMIFLALPGSGPETDAESDAAFQRRARPLGAGWQTLVERVCHRP
ncbi:helix-turn-helix domain-containing protein [Streptomyces sp. NPDC048641]|uniref:TetR/AcrR family transcriptional regulator n=1 Tax=unclassified Streptomyces TaxID=2593676 RepID=UPI003419C18C